MKRLTVGSLFSGIGGIDLGLERAGMEIRWHSEIDPYASRVLAKHWPGVPNLGDITRIDFTAVEPVDVLAGGFPCQDISTAGKGAGIEGERSGLWREYARAVGELRPRYVFVENVAALLVRGLDRVLGDLAALGYDAEWDCIPASALGAPHRRDRLWLVAHTRGEPAQLLRGSRQLARPAGATEVEGDQRERGRDASRGGGAPLADTDAQRLQGRGLPKGSGRSAVLHTPGRRPRLFGSSLRPRREWAPEPDVGRVADGIPARVDRLRGLGNAVVPQTPELIGGWIIDHARSTGYLESAA